MYIGVDIGGTNIAAGVVNSGGRILRKESVKTRTADGYKAILDDIAALIESLRASGDGTEDIIQIGVGCPGCCNQDTGIVELCVNLGWKDVPLVRDLGAIVGIPVTIENDANAAAFGEFVAGAARGAKSAVAITLGTGVGAGVIIDGKLLHGSNYAGGELGHIVMEVGGEPCGCGRRGCFEAYSSATALIRDTRRAMDANPDSLMHPIAAELGKISARGAWLARTRGDAAGTAVVEKYIEYLAEGIANVVNIFQPEIVCIGGGVCNEGDNLLIPLKAAVASRVYGGKSPRIAVCELGNDAGIIGAALCS
ncbi:MAG: ROK family protein [Oscillospiraceae bacterium]|nr:ROK family protein [Oscillospiraceae bacterium]